MSKALPGEHYCLQHQGNHSHYDPTNCTVCRLETRCRAAEAFIRELIEMTDEGCGVEGWDLQDLFVKHGFLKPHPVTEPCNHAYCLCAEYDNIPGDCLRSTLENNND